MITRWILAVLTLLVAACRESLPSPTIPSPSIQPPTILEPPSPGVTFTLSGVVYESTLEGLRPLANAPLELETRNYVPWVGQEATTDAEGRYRVSGWSLAFVRVLVQKRGYAQPCRAMAWLSRDSILDIHVVSTNLLSTSGAPPSMPTVPPILSGLVFEQTPEGERQPIPDVALGAEFSGGHGWWFDANTVSDATGRYFFCGASEPNIGFEVLVDKRGYFPKAPSHPLLSAVYVARPGTLDIELVRR